MGMFYSYSGVGLGWEGFRVGSVMNFRANFFTLKKIYLFMYVIVYSKG
jgi:hypothetical protein